MEHPRPGDLPHGVHLDGGPAAEPGRPLPEPLRIEGAQDTSAFSFSSDSSAAFADCCSRAPASGASAAPSKPLS